MRLPIGVSHDNRRSLATDTNGGNLIAANTLNDGAQRFARYPPPVLWVLLRAARPTVGVDRIGAMGQMQKVAIDIKEAGLRLCRTEVNTYYVLITQLYT